MLDEERHKDPEFKETPDLPLPAEEDDLVEEVEEILEEEGVDPEAIEKVASVIIRAQTWVGPLPPPDIIEAYERIFPGSADRIFGRAEREQAHRHAMEQAEQKAYHGHRTRSLTYAGILFLVALIFCYITAISGHPKVAIALLTVPLLGVISLFVRGYHNEKQAKESKNTELDGPE